MESWYLYVLVGFVCGVFGATFGVGSGILMIPALVLLFAFPQKSAQGACLAAMVPMALAGAIRYKLNPDIEVNLVAVGFLSAGAVAGALVGSSIAAWTSGQVLRRLFAVIMIVVAVKMLATAGPQSGPGQTARASQTAEERPHAD